METVTSRFDRRFMRAGKCNPTEKLAQYKTFLLVIDIESFLERPPSCSLLILTFSWDPRNRTPHQPRRRGLAL
jgi:hypothetical protein